MNDTSTSFMRRLAVPLAAALVLAGCSLTPQYERPAAPVPAHWPGAQLAEGGPAEDQALLKLFNERFFSSGFC